jgi:hypothetical protein
MYEVRCDHRVVAYSGTLLITDGYWNAQRRQGISVYSNLLSSRARLFSALHIVDPRVPPQLCNVAACISMHSLCSIDLPPLASCLTLLVCVIYLHVQSVLIAIELRA